MGSVVFGLLFVLGLLLAVSGLLVNQVQAFQESWGWGLLSLLIPWIFVFKFWRHNSVRWVFWMGLGGLGLSLASVAGLLASLPLPNLAELLREDSAGQVAHAAGYSARPPNPFDRGDGDNDDDGFEPFRQGISFAQMAAEQTQQAETVEEWDEVAQTWDYAIAMMEFVPASDPNFAVAQQKVQEYGKNLGYASQKAQPESPARKSSQ